MRKLPAAAQWWLLPLILTFLMTAVVAAISTVQALGVVPGLLVIWFKAWMWSWLVAAPTMMLVMPFARRFVARLTEPPRR